MPDRFDALQLGLFVGLFQQAGQELCETPHPAVTFVLQVELKAAGLAQALNGGRCKGQWQASFDAAGFHIRFHHQFFGRLVTLGPGFERKKHRGSRRLQTPSPQKIQAHQAEHGVDIFVGRHGRLHLLDDLVGALQRRALGQDHRADEVALVFVRHQSAGHDFDHEPRQAQHAHKQQHAQHAALEEEGHALRVALRQAFEAAVKPVKKLVLSFGTWLEQHRAQSRRQRQRHKARQHHGDRDGDGELAVQLARQSAQKCHGDEGRTQHQHDGDHRAGHLPHGFNRGVTRAHAFFMHEAFHVFQHHDGVVHHDADGQHHAKQRQRVDAVAQQVQACHGADQRHGHRQRGDDGGAPALQKQVHDEEHQHHGFGQGLDHLVNGLGHKRRGVVGGGIGQADGELGL